MQNSRCSEAATQLVGARSMLRHHGAEPLRSSGLYSSVVTTLVSCALGPRLNQRNHGTNDKKQGKVRHLHNRRDSHLPSYVSLVLWGLIFHLERGTKMLPVLEAEQLAKVPPPLEDQARTTWVPPQSAHLPPAEFRTVLSQPRAGHRHAR